MSEDKKELNEQELDKVTGGNTLQFDQSDSSFTPPGGTAGQSVQQWWTIVHSDDTCGNWEMDSKISQDIAMSQQISAQFGDNIGELQICALCTHCEKATGKYFCTRQD